MEREEAEAERHRRNRELGERRVTDRYWVEVQRADGSWEVAERQEPPPEPQPRWKALLQGLLDTPWPF